jgi:hypothetical protein
MHYSVVSKSICRVFPFSTPFALLSSEFHIRSQFSILSSPSGFDDQRKSHGKDAKRSLVLSPSGLEEMRKSLSEDDDIVSPTGSLKRKINSKKEGRLISKRLREDFPYQKIRKFSSLLRSRFCALLCCDFWVEQQRDF